jgi:hypothetical protein
MNHSSSAITVTKAIMSRVILPMPTPKPETIVSGQEYPPYSAQEADEDED